MLFLHFKKKFKSKQAVDSLVSFADRGSTNYDILLCLFCVILIISNISATKGILFNVDLLFVNFSLITDGGALLFPLAYVLGDVLSEVYGFKAARRAIVMGFLMSALASVSFWLVILAPAADFYENQDSFENVLGFVPLIVLASLLGYLVGQTLNSWVLVKIKSITKEKKLWLRLLGSTGVGELADTFIFCVIAAQVIGINSFSDFLNYFVVGYLYKCLVEILFMPFTYKIISWIKRSEPSYGLGVVG